METRCARIREVLLAISNPSRIANTKKQLDAKLEHVEHLTTVPRLKKMFDNLVKVILDKAPSCCIDGPICAKHCVSGTSLQIPGVAISNQKDARHFHFLENK